MDTAHRHTGSLSKLASGRIVVSALPASPRRAPSSPPRPGRVQVSLSQSHIPLCPSALAQSWPHEAQHAWSNTRRSPWATQQVWAGESTVPTEQRGLGPLSVPSLAAALLSYPPSRLPPPQLLTPAWPYSLTEIDRRSSSKGSGMSQRKGWGSPVAELESTQEIREGCLEVEALVMGFLQVELELARGLGNPLVRGTPQQLPLEQSEPTSVPVGRIISPVPLFFNGGEAHKLRVTIFKRRLQGHEVPVRRCASFTTIHLQNWVIFPN